MKSVGVAILGFGTVGAGVADCLTRRRGVIASRAGVDVRLVRVADLDTETDRGVALPDGVLGADASAAIADPAVDIVVETIGGTGVAKKFMLDAIAAGKSVVTANKKLLAETGGELFAAAAAKGVDLYFGAAVGGGIPVIRAVRDALAANEFVSIAGILNGTCNYILTRMEKDGLRFDDALAEAQSHGFAEADPTLDIDGFDTAHKICILANLAFDRGTRLEDVEIKGIRGISVEEVAAAARAGGHVKLLGRAALGSDGRVEVTVRPEHVPAGALLGCVEGVYNAVEIESEPAGKTVYVGKGAGRNPTASTVAADVCEIARNIARGVVRNV